MNQISIPHEIIRRASSDEPLALSANAGLMPFAPASIAISGNDGLLYADDKGGSDGAAKDAANDAEASGIEVIRLANLPADVLHAIQAAKGIPFLQFAPGGSLVTGCDLVLI
jgi:hypothetical protein